MNNAFGNEFGRDNYQNVIAGFNIRGSRGGGRPRTANNVEEGNKQLRNAHNADDVECDDYPCTASDPSDGSSSKKGSKSSKSRKVAKDGKYEKAADAAKESKYSKYEKATDAAAKTAKQGKTEKREKSASNKEIHKLTKNGGERLLSPLFDTFGREEIDGEDHYEQR
jgi:hypothetical protein